MSGNAGRVSVAAVLLIVLSIGVATVAGVDARQTLRENFRRLDRRATWRRTAAIPLRFNTHHPQGMVRVGEHFYLSAVEVVRETERYREPIGGHDRSPGAGVGHLFKFDAEGRLLEDLRIGEGTIYHPGGIDYDGRYIWMPVAEYRPRSRSIIYRIDPRRPLAAREITRFDDHLGGVVHRREDGTLHAVSWGSRWLYQLPLNAGQRVRRRLNSSFYIDYQDCHYLGENQMLCGGLSGYENPATGQRLSLGGLDLIDLVTGRPLHQLPLELWSETGRPMTQNPFWVEPQPDSRRGLQFWFLPDDGQSTLYCYEVTHAD